jgi:hypothetical protein
MGTTPILGLPFPEDTDPVAQGADAIEALADALDTYLSSPGWVAADPQIRQNGVDWPLGDFGGTPGDSGNTEGWYRVRAGVVEGWQLGVLNANGPTFPPTPAAPCYARMPFAPTDFRPRHVVGSWVLISFDDSTVASGIMRYDQEIVAGQHWARLSQNLNSSFQYGLGLKWHYPTDVL